MKLSKNFTLEEFVTSAEAKVRCIDNYPSENHIASMKNLCINVLEKIRLKYSPIIISSGYRSKTLNEAVSGSKSSQHSKGEAVDIVIPKVDIEEVYQWIKQSGIIVDQCIQEFGRWIHVSFSTTNRQQFLRALKKGSKTIYVKDKL